MKATTETKPTIVKTGDFEADTRAGFYRQERNIIYEKVMAKRNQKKDVFATDEIVIPESTWYEDFRKFLLDNGVPAQYVGKVAHMAYEQGHSSGEEEILNFAYGLIELFK